MCETTSTGDGRQADQAVADHHKVIHYKVNGELQDSTDRKPKVRTILSQAGFEPPEDYELTRDNGNHTFKSLDDEVPLHEGETFTATFTGPTPTS